ncbi:hypothetical protein DTO282E5_1146 [Paecilomyces variotii]|nr:hypothetical protein DTO282E5_1146 [Paecilomyces variotii]
MTGAVLKASTRKQQEKVQAREVRLTRQDSETISTYRETLRPQNSNTLLRSAKEMKTRESLNCDKKGILLPQSLGCWAHKHYPDGRQDRWADEELPGARLDFPEGEEPKTVREEVESQRFAMRSEC